MVTPLSTSGDTFPRLPVHDLKYWLPIGPSGFLSVNIYLITEDKYNADRHVDSIFGLRRRDVQEVPHIYVFRTYRCPAVRSAADTSAALIILFRQNFFHEMMHVEDAVIKMIKKGYKSFIHKKNYITEKRSIKTEKPGMQ